MQMQVVNTLRIDTFDEFAEWLRILDERAVATVQTKEINQYSIEQTHKAKARIFIFARLFWFLFDWTIGFLIGFAREIKTCKFIKNHLSENERLLWKTGDGKAKILAQARRNFGQNQFSDIFKIRTRFFNKNSAFIQKLCESVANAPALDAAYNVNGNYGLNGVKFVPKLGKPDFWAKLHLNCPDGHAVRARHDFAIEYIVDFFKNRNDGRILEVACGPGQPVILALAELKKLGIRVETVLTDFSDEALTLARERAEQVGVKDQISFIQAPFVRLPKVLAKEKFDLVLAVGINDYLEDKASIRLTGICLDFLDPDGDGEVLISNMNRTRRGSRSMSKIFNWDIIYRKPEELGRLAKKAGAGQVKLYQVDPWGIHLVASLKVASGWLWEKIDRR
ncbi:MAG: class I SAM-dependent methyltransferase [bacterium]